jgi:hypothetical protein
MYRPDFPNHNYLELQRSRIKIGDSRHSDWGTTYDSAMRPHTQQIARQSLDTTFLQRTHWTPGDLPGGNRSEYHARYQDFSSAEPSRPQLSREDMMRTSIRFGDGTPMPARAAVRQPVTETPPRASLRDRMVATHFDLTNPADMDARPRSTHQSDFRAPHAPPPAKVETSLNRGQGARATFEQMGGFGSGASLMRESFRPSTTLPGARASSVTVSGNRIEFADTPMREWQRTHFAMGDTTKRFSTTTGDAHQLPPLAAAPAPADPNAARDRHAQLMWSSIPTDRNFATVAQTTSQSAHRPFGVEPTPLAERTAFVSHHDYRNWRGRPTTTTRESYPPRPVEITPPIVRDLQGSNATFGNDAINEKTTLYRETFRPPGRTQELAPIQELRDFHQAHHSRCERGQNERLETTTHEATYRGCPGGRAADLCEGLRGGHNVVAKDPQFTVRQSAMRQDFVPHRGGQRPPPIDNFLQRSHVQLQGNGEAWTTTQSDYFQWQRYKMPHSSF